MKLCKRIISFFLVVSLIMMNTRINYAIATEFNESVAVDESIQLKIEVGATKIEWSTSSKRIATVSKTGLVTGIKKGTCDITCRAEYSKFVFFKDVVNYTFHINVLEKRHNVSNSVAANQEDYARVYYELFVGDEDVTNIAEFQTEIIKKGEVLKEKPNPSSPLMNFKEWCLDLEGKEIFQFGHPVENDIVLFAKWEIDEKDTDDDGLLDVLESNKYHTSIYEKDTDGDGLSDFDEIQNGLNPLLKDSNGNGIIDFDDDLDEDELKNGDEVKYITDMSLVDTDRDNLLDGEEVNKYKTNPCNEDTDGDGATDGWEVKNGFDPLVYNATFKVTGTSNEVSVANPVALEVVLNSNGENAESLCISPQLMSDTYMASATVPGYMGYMYDISTAEEINNATLTFTYDEQRFGTINSNFQPRVYYVNENDGTYEELANQMVENGKVIVEVNHFSKYILLNSVEFNKIWEREIKLPNSNVNSMEGIDMALIIDSSGSMTSSDPKNIRLDVCDKIIDKLADSDKASIIDFDGNKVLCNLTNNKSDLKSAVRRINSDGGTSLYKGLREGAEILKSSGGNRYKAIFFLTDGKDNNGNGVNASSKKSLDNLVDEAITNNIIINTIGLGHDIEESLLRYDIAERTGGKYYFAEDAEALNTVVDDYIIDTIDYTTDTNGDGISDYYTELLKSGTLFMQGFPRGINLNDYGDDFDNDGLKNGEEIEILVDKNGRPYVRIYSNPFVADTDYDGFTDYEEKQRGSYVNRYDKKKDEIDYFLSVDEKTYKALASYDNNSPLYILKRLVVNAKTIKDVYTTLLTKYFTEYSMDSYVYNGDIMQNKVIDNICDQILGKINSLCDSGKYSIDAISGVNKTIGAILSVKPIVEFIEGVPSYNDEKIDLLMDLVDNFQDIFFGKFEIPYTFSDFLDVSGNVSGTISMVLDFSKMKFDEIDKLTALYANCELIKNNMVILNDISKYSKNHDANMIDAAETIIQSVRSKVLGLIESHRNLNINVGRYLLREGSLRVLTYATGVPISDIINVLVFAVDLKNKYGVVQHAFDRLSTEDKYNTYSEFQGVVLMHKTAVETIRTLSNVKNNYYVFGDKVNSIDNSLITTANASGMGLNFLVQSRILIKNNVCSVQYGSYGSSFNIEQAKYLVNKLRLPISENFYNANIPQHYIVQGK